MCYVLSCKNIYIHAVRCAAVLLIAGGASIVMPAYGQQPTPDGMMPERLAVFLDCQGCDETFIRQELTVVDHVREPQQAHVHVLVTSQNTGGGGEVQTLDLIGLGPFEGQDYTTTYTTASSDTQDDERTGFLRTLRVALVPYLMQTPISQRLALEIEGEDAELVQPTVDPWNGWTFEIYGSGFGEKESSQYALSLRYGVEVEHVSEAWKVNLQPNFSYDFDRFERGDNTITSTAREDGFDALVVKSISPHWSAGLFGSVFASTFSNIDLQFRLQPAIEFSVFPYRESTRRQLTFAYLVGGSHVDYEEITIFDKATETLGQHALDARYEVTQPWGEAEIGMQASQYFHDTSKYGIEFDGEVEVRLTEGLSIEFGGQVELIHDQLNLPRGDASLEETLLRRRELATNYEISGQIGFEYRFGSIYNNVVNPRFGGGDFD